MSVTDESGFEEFVRRLERRPAGMSPLMYVASMEDQPAEVSVWLLRWLKEQR